ncbi:toprim domain-containing protein [Methylobacterium sp. J-030]|uniref:DUF7146 domain-containing protein n=1 Tax=Methylobacterium sp. J-030 TaxID=2836627 RepID=UPI001FB87375|nr:toprim domain-containing protein [Methylobacterium sp. J-030]MCJ2070041.1 toprim domain-containing protein [Methylobacterium sp. J-030]
MTPTLSEIASALRGQVAGRHVLAPGPGHSHRDRSLSVRLSETSPDGFIVHSHAGDDWRACRDHVAAALGLAEDRWRETCKRHPAAIQRREEARHRAEAQERAEAEWRQRRVMEMWRSTRPPEGTPAETYLRSRGLDLRERLNETIRFHPHCAWGHATAPAIVAPMRCIRTGSVRGVHRTGLDSGARKIGRRMFGVASGTAIMFDPVEGGGGFLVVGEGIETTLTARQHLGLAPAWALGSSGAIAALPVLADVHTLIVLAENDANGASARAAEQVGARWLGAGRAVEIVWPPEGAKDLNDTVRKDSQACR